MFNFIWLLFAHYIGDCSLQTQFMSERKRKYKYILFCHCMVWTGIICAVLQYLRIFSLWKTVFLLSGHFIIDFWKSKIPDTKENYKYIFIDQPLHILQLFIVYIL